MYVHIIQLNSFIQFGDQIILIVQVNLGIEFKATKIITVVLLKNDLSHVLYMI